ncbi:natural resistance-associated macrophage protein-domain-containing protein [Suillus ampliporus]|nr:natural resistance-associated macrophage protein-domain-containing protein [Suillus ampliporus]
MTTSPNQAAADPQLGGGTTSPEKHWIGRLQHIGWTVFHHAQKHTGVGVVCSVAYFDPGNWGVDLQAGSQYGYKLLFVVLLAGLFAAFLQVLACRLGVVTGLDLASHCRILFHNRPRHTKLWRWGVLYPLYVLSEVAIVSTDLAELLGSAIALCLLFPALPLWAGVLITGADVLLILALGNPLHGRPVKIFEWIIASLVLAVLICMVIIIAKIDVVWVQALDGFVPSKAIFSSGALYTCMCLFLGSHLATQDRLSKKPLAPVSSLSDKVQKRESTGVASRHEHLRCLGRAIWRKFRSLFVVSLVELEELNARPKSHEHRDNNALEFIRSHLYHGMIDMVASLLGFAVIINALILILASAVFYYGSGAHGSESPASLFDAHTLISNTIGKGAALLFALALLAAGQSASIVATVAGQSVSEGFLNWKVSPVVRRIVTRLLGLIPSMAVAIVVGPNGVDSLLVASQVVLSIVLPFIVFPLICLTSSSRIMRTEEFVDFSSGKLMTSLGWLIWLVIVAANVYVLVTL